MEILYVLGTNEIILLKIKIIYIHFEKDLRSNFNKFLDNNTRADFLELFVIMV